MALDRSFSDQMTSFLAVMKSQSYDLFLTSIFCSLLSRSTKCNAKYKYVVYTGETCFYSTSSQPMREFHACCIWIMGAYILQM